MCIGETLPAKLVTKCANIIFCDLSVIFISWFTVWVFYSATNDIPCEVTSRCVGSILPTSRK